MDGSLVIWKPSFSIFKPISTYKHSSLISGFVWSLGSNEIHIADLNGNVSTCKDVVPDLFEGFAIPNPFSIDISPAELRVNTTRNELDNLGEFLFNVEEDMQEESPVKSISGQKFIANSYSLSEDEEELYPDNNDLDDFIVDDDGGKLDPSKYKNLQEISSFTREKQATTKKQTHVIENTQPCFQPGSTILKSQRRYLSFNLIGVIYSIIQDAYSTIHVEFHDTSIKSFHISDHYGYNIAALGSNGSVFACPGSATNPSTIFYRPISNWTSSNEWVMQLNEIENASVVGVTKKYVVVATDLNYVRFYSLGGVQLFIYSLSGSMVSISSSEDSCSVFTSVSGNINAIIYDLDMQVESKIDCGLSRNSTLEWVGYSFSGDLLTWDSDGVLRVYYKSGWVPLLDTRTRKVKGDVYWPVGVYNDNFMCIICKGGDKFPGFPKPMLMEVPLVVPFINTDVGMLGEQEEKLFRSFVTLSNQALDPAERLRIQTEMDRATLRLINVFLINLGCLYSWEISKSFGSCWTIIL